jgi:hypothetical protein
MPHAPLTWVAPNANGRLQVFVVGADHVGGQSLWQLPQKDVGNRWSNWFSHGAPPGSCGLRWSPALARSSGGSLEVFVVGDDLEPEGLESVERSITGHSSTVTVSGRPGGRMKPVDLICVGRRPLRWPPMDACRCLLSRKTEPYGICGRPAPNAHGHSAFHMALRRGMC